MTLTAGSSIGFGRGIISPDYQGTAAPGLEGSLEMAENCIVSPSQALHSRPGTALVMALSGTPTIRLVPFFNRKEETLAIGIAPGVMYFFRAGAIVRQAGTPLQVAHGYRAEHLFELSVVQSFDVLTFTHPQYHPFQLTRVGPTTWTFSPVYTGPQFSPPTGVGVTVKRGDSPSTQTYEYSYVVTAGDADGLAESVVSAAATQRGNINETGAENTIAWTAPGTITPATNTPLQAFGTGTLIQQIIGNTPQAIARSVSVQAIGGTPPYTYLWQDISVNGMAFSASTAASTLATVTVATPQGLTGTAVCVITDSASTAIPVEFPYIYTTQSEAVVL